VKALRASRAEPSPARRAHGLWSRAGTCAVLLLLASLVAGAAPQSITGAVERVFDGDSMIVRARGRDIEVRLAEIDTPEKGQPYADTSRKALQGMVLGKKVRLTYWKASRSVLPCRPTSSRPAVEVTVRVLPEKENANGSSDHT